jgi:hypothetical protein
MLQKGTEKLHVVRLMFTEVLGLALKVEAELRFRRFESVLAGLEKQSSVRSRGVVPAERLQRAIRGVYRVLPFEPTCLKQSLIFCRAWRRRGLTAELRIGVQKEGGVFAAHAWVEDGAGNVLTDPQEGFNALPLSPGPPRGDGATG